MERQLPTKPKQGTRRIVYVPKWTTKIISLLLTGVSVLLFVAYGYHLGKAMHYGIPASYVVVSVAGVLPYALPAILAALLIAVLAVPAVHAVRDIFRILFRMQQEHRELVAMLLTAVLGLLPVLGVMCTSFTIIDAVNALAFIPRVPSLAGLVIHVIVWALSVLFVVMAYEGRKHLASTNCGKDQNAGGGAWRAVWRLMCHMSYHLCRLVAWIVATWLVLKIFGTTLMVMAAALPVTAIAVLHRSNELTRLYQFRVIAYPTFEHPDNDEPMEQAWLRGTRWCILFGAAIAGCVFILSVFAGSESARDLTVYPVASASTESKLSLGHAKDDDVSLCVLDVYDATSAVAVEAAPSQAGGYEASLKSSSVVVVDPSVGFRRERCVVTDAPEEDTLLLLFRKVSGR